jgi:hypothetical protein
VKKPVSKLAFQVHNLQRYTAEPPNSEWNSTLDTLELSLNGGALQVESS